MTVLATSSLSKYFLVIFVYCIVAAVSFQSLKAPIHQSGRLFSASSSSQAAKPRVSIEYCTGCRWLLRSSWLAQELLTTFEKEIGEVSLKPNNDKPGGKFVVTVDGEVIWDRKSPTTPGFPEAKELKQLVRDKINPTMDLGHSDKPSNKVFEVPDETA